MEEPQENISEGNNSMEELKVEEDENIKELSAEEDILGTQSLLMSESDEDSNSNIKIRRRKLFPNRTKRILDSEDEKDQSTDRNIKENEIMLEKKTLIVSDNDQISSNEDDNKSFETSDEVSNIGRKELKQVLIKSKLNKKVKRKSKKESNHFQLRHCSDLDFNAEKSDRNNSKLDSEDIKKKENMKNNSLIDSESSDTEGKNSELAKQPNFQENNENSKEKSRSKIMRASAKKAMDDMQAIQSEQQRLHREAQISIPYHKPRKHTLDEFLMRRTIIHPQKASPVTAEIQRRNLKMTTDELEEYAKLMEERAKEATEFFKAESENDEEENLKDNDGLLDKLAETAKESDLSISTELLNLPNEIELPLSSNGDNLIDDLTRNQNSVQLNDDELKARLTKEDKILIEQERPTCSKVLITEVIELPKLDMNTVRISPTKNHISTSYLNVKQLLDEKTLSGSPSLSGDPNKLIDLESGDLIEKKPTGIESLMKRLMSTVRARKLKNSDTCNILSVENGKLEMSKVNISRIATKDVQKDAKPGAAYFQLKKNLKEIIKKKRLEEMNKKQEDELEYSKCLADEDEYDDDNEEDDGDGEEICIEDYKPKSKVAMVDDDENGLVVEDDEYNTDIIDDSEQSENTTDEDEEDKDLKEINNDENTATLNNSQPKNRIIKGFNDTDEEGQNDDIDFLKTPQVIQQPLLETETFLKTTLDEEENELMALCSGTFDETQKTCVAALISQIPVTQTDDKGVNDEELMGMCSGTFDQPSLVLQSSQFGKIAQHFTTKCNKILSSDEENDEKFDKNKKNKQKIKKLLKKRRKKKAKLGFSDDEDEDTDEEKSRDEKEGGALENDLETATENPETFVDYDSEENEIIVKMTKNDKLTKAQNFLEKEAELSESEWGSADEDENNLDKYDIELGDEDEFDREKLRTELGQIHARKMLDEDIREVRKIQEMFFEDEEKDGIGRQRTFKWKNAENGFSLDDGQLLDETGDGQNGDSGDEINEHQWRKIRYEREQFLKEQGLKPDSQDTAVAIPLNSPTTLAASTKKLQIITVKKTALSPSESEKNSPFLISEGISSLRKKSIRGSFLVRDKATLNKLAGLTKGTSSTPAFNMDDTSGTVSVKNIKQKNFVFATLTEEEHENIKRKADDLLNSSNENGKNFMKKSKIEHRRDKCFIDQLL